MEIQNKSQQRDDINRWQVIVWGPLILARLARKRMAHTMLSSPFACWRVRYNRPAQWSTGPEISVDLLQMPGACTRVRKMAEGYGNLECCALSYNKANNMFFIICKLDGIDVQNRNRMYTGGPTHSCRYTNVVLCMCTKII